MSLAMKLVYYAPGDIRQEDQPSAPMPKKGEVLIKVEACAICGSDVKTFRLGNPRITPPRTMGHEFCGTIVSVGEQVDAYTVGQRVSMATTMGCGTCAECRMGKPNICVDLQAIGFHHDGAMASWVLIPERGVRGGNLIDVGDLAPEVAALSEPTSCVVNSLSKLKGRGGRTILVIGLGPLGLIHGMMARDLGFETVIGAARPGKRFDSAQHFGFDDIILSDAIPDAIERYTSKRGFDAVVVTAPSAEVQSAAPSYAAKSGAISLFAGLPTGSEMISINSRTIHYGEQMVYGTSDSTPEHVRMAVSWLRENTEKANKLITHHLPLSHFHEAMKTVIDRNALKAVLIPEN